MSVFTLVISYLNTTNLLWFMDVTLQVLMQYCSLQHQTLLPSPATSITECCFCFGSIPSFFLELFLHWSPVAYCTPNDLGSSSFGTLSSLPVHGVAKSRTRLNDWTELTMILNGLPWKWIEIILSLLRLHPSTAFWTLLLTMMAIPFLIRDSCPQY